jgi:hypothetical protein
MKRWILNKLLSHLFNAVTENDILRSEGQGLTRNGQPLTNAQVEELRNGAQTLETFYVFQQLLTDMKHAANERMYQHSRSDDDMVFGKAALWTIDVLERKIESLSKLK